MDTAAAVFLLVSGLVGIVALLFYFLPAVVAGMRGHPNTAAIFLLNLLLGWSFLGWVVALVWAFTAVHRPGSVEGKPAPSSGGWVLVAVLGLAVGLPLAAAALFIFSFVQFPDAGPGSWVKNLSATSRDGLGSDRIPPEVEVARLREEIARLDDDLKKSVDALARQEVEVIRLKKEIGTARENKDRQAREILALNKALEVGGEVIVLDGKQFPAERARTKLTEALAALKQSEDGLAEREKLLGAKEDLLEGARVKFAALREQKAQLETELTRIDIALKLSGPAYLSDPASGQRLDAIKADLGQLNERIEKLKREADPEARLGEPPPRPGGVK